MSKIKYISIFFMCFLLSTVNIAQELELKNGKWKLHKGSVGKYEDSLVVNRKEEGKYNALKGQLLKQLDKKQSSLEFSKNNESRSNPEYLKKKVRTEKQIEDVKRNIHQAKRMQDLDINQVSNLSTDLENLGFNTKKLNKAINNYHSINNKSNELDPKNIIQEPKELIGYQKPLSDSIENIKKLPDYVWQQQHKLPDIHSNMFPSIDFDKLTEAGTSQVNSDIMSTIITEQKKLLKSNKLKITEKALADSLQMVTLQERQRFMNRTYFDGIIGINKIDKMIIGLSPNVGYQITKTVSSGLGMDFQLNYEGGLQVSTIGIKAFGKYEPIPQKIYLLTEFVTYIPRTFNLNIEDKKKDNYKWSIDVGAGYLLALSRTKSLNFSIIYKTTMYNSAVDYISPWSVRIGLTHFNK